MLKDRRNSSKPTQYPRQAQLPSPEQLREIYQQSVKSAGTAIELPFGDNFVLSVARKSGTGGCEWVLYRREDGGAKLPEWSYESTDPRWIHLQIAACFPNWSPVRQYSSSAKGANEGWVPPPPEKGQVKSKHAIMEGQIANVSLKRLLGSIGTDRLTGQLEIHPDKLVGTIYVNDGRPVHCQYGKYEGKTALKMLLRMTEAKFLFYAGARTERVSLPRDLEPLLNPSPDNPEKSERKKKPKREGVNAVIFGESDDDDDPDTDDEDEFEDDNERILNPLYVEGKPALLGQNARTDSRVGSDGADDGPGEIQQNRPSTEKTSSTDTTSGTTHNRTEAEPSEKGEQKRKLNPFEHLSLKMSGRVPVPTPRRTEAADPPPKHHALANDSSTTFAKPASRKLADQTGDHPQIQESGNSSSAAVEPTQAKEVLRPEDFLQQPSPESLEQPALADQPAEKAQRPLEGGSSEHSLQNHLPQQMEIPPTLAPALQQALQQAMSIQRPPLQTHTPAQPASPVQPQAPSQPPPVSPHRTLNSLMPQVHPAKSSNSNDSTNSVSSISSTYPVDSSNLPNSVMPPLPVQPSDNQKSQALSESNMPEQQPASPEAQPATIPPVMQAATMAPSAWRGPDPNKPADQSPVTTIKAKSADTNQGWLDDIVIDDEEASGNTDEDAGQEPLAAENHESEATPEQEQSPSTDIAPAMSPHPMQQTLHEISVSENAQNETTAEAQHPEQENNATSSELEVEPSSSPGPMQDIISAHQTDSSTALPPSQTTVLEDVADSDHEPSHSVPPMQPTMHDIVATAQPETSHAVPPMQKTMHEIAAIHPEPHHAAPPMQRTMHEMPASLQPNIQHSNQPEPSAAPESAVESQMRLSQASESALSPTEIALQHQAEVSSKTRTKSGEVNAPSSTESANNAQFSRQSDAVESRWPDDGISLLNSPDAPGYSKKERFQVRMSLVNRSTQLIAYPVLMYMTEMEFVRAARYNRAFSMIVIQVGTKSGNGDSPVEPLDVDGVALLGTKIMDIKRSPDLLGHFDPDGLAILMPETERASANQVADRIATLIRSIQPTEWTRWKPLQYMIGVASAPDDCVSLQGLLDEVFKFDLRHIIED